MKMFLFLSLALSSPIFTQHGPEYQLLANYDSQGEESNLEEDAPGGATQALNYLSTFSCCAGTLGTALNTLQVAYYDQTCNIDNPQCMHFHLWQESPIYFAIGFGLITLSSICYLSSRQIARCRRRARPVEPFVPDIENGFADEHD